MNIKKILTTSMVSFFLGTSFAMASEAEINSINDYEIPAIDRSNDYLDNYGENFQNTNATPDSVNATTAAQYVECGVETNNAGCSRTFSCPPGQLIASYKAACNLEWGKVTVAQLNAVPLNHTSVVRNSDNINDGHCTVGTDSISSGIAYSGNPLYRQSVNFGCKEHDNNGGDCHIRAVFTCAAF